MNVLVVNCVFFPEPIVSASIGQDLSLHLGGLNNHSVLVITPPPSRPFGFKFNTEYDKPKNYELIRLNSYTYPKSGIIGRLRESISFGLKSYKFIIASKNLDMVYMNTWPIFGQLGVALACKKKKILYITHVQDIYPESLINKLSAIPKYFIGLLLFPIDKFILNNSSKIIAISNNMKDYLAKTRKISSNKITVVTNWQNEDYFKKYQDSWPLLSQKLTFMYLGNIGPVAGVDFLIHSFAKSNINARLIIAGSGTEKENCIEKAEEFKSVDIEFMNVPEGKVAEIQSLAHVLLLPTKKSTGNNSIPSKLPAYMFSARPIITLSEKNSDIAQSIEKANCGWIGVPEDEEWLINCFQEIITLDQSILRAKGMAGLQFAKANFSKDKNLTKLVNIILN